MNGDLHVICFWDDIKHKFNFPRVNSFRITQEGMTLRMQSEIDNYGESFCQLVMGWISINGSMSKIIAILMA